MNSLGLPDGDGLHFTITNSPPPMSGASWVAHQCQGRQSLNGRKHM